MGYAQELRERGIYDHETFDHRKDHTGEEELKWKADTSATFRTADGMQGNRIGTIRAKAVPASSPNSAIAYAKPNSSGMIEMSNMSEMKQDDPGVDPGVKALHKEHIGRSVRVMETFKSNCSGNRRMIQAGSRGVIVDVDEGLGIADVAFDCDDDDTPEHVDISRFRDGKLQVLRVQQADDDGSESTMSSSSDGSTRDPGPRKFSPVQGRSSLAGKANPAGRGSREKKWSITERQDNGFDQAVGLMGQSRISSLDTSEGPSGQPIQLQARMSKRGKIKIF